MRPFSFKSRRVCANAGKAAGGDKAISKKWKRLLFTFTASATLFIGVQSFAAFDYGMFGAAGSAQGYSGITRYNDALSMRNNPALMAFEGMGGLSMEFTRPEGIAGLDRMSFAAALTLSRKYGFAIGLSAVMSGDEVWRENDYGMSFSFAPFSGLSLGVTGRVLHLDIAGVGTVTLPTADIAFLFHPLPSLRLAGSVYAVNQPKTGLEKGDYIESTFRMACAYEAFPGITLSGGAQIDSLGLSPSFGSEYALYSFFVVRACYETAPAAFTLGLGFLYDKYNIDFSSRIPLQGGEFTHTMSLAWSWEASGEEGREGFGRLSFAPINVNTAREKDIASLPGVNARLAERIVRERVQRKIYSLDDLFRIPGFTRTVMKKINGQIAVSDDGKGYVTFETDDGTECHINGYGIKELIALGIRADTARRIVLLKKDLRGFLRIEDLYLMPNSETNWIPVVCRGGP
jgi:hypothetical protein